MVPEEIYEKAATLMTRLRRLLPHLLAVFLLSVPSMDAARHSVQPASRRGPAGPRIRALLNSTPIARTAFWGIEISDLESGRVLFDVNADHFFVPASNTKLFTTALALMRLGPDYRTRTTVLQEGADLVLLGGGDPNLSGRAIPYEMGAPRGNPLTAIESLADQIVARGVRRVEGNVIGDDTAFVFEPYPEGWSIQDLTGDDGAPVSALTVNDNSVKLKILPADVEGALARISWDPVLPLFDIENLVVTDSRVEKKIHLERQPGSRQLRIWGTIPRLDLDGRTFTLAVDDPARFAAYALMDALQRRGVFVNGGAIARHLYPGAYPSVPTSTTASTVTTRPPPIAERVSGSLVDDLRVMEKVSQNLHAEMILRTVARERAGAGSRVAGLAELQLFLEEIGIGKDQYSFHDGSGLSRLNVVTPSAICSLLRYMGTSPQRDNWLSLFPISGVDGTLSGRFGNKRARGRIRAKTGSLTHASALSGYLERRDGRVLVFSIVANNYNGPAFEIRAVIDRICYLLLE